MSGGGVGLRAVAVSFPRGARRNDYFRAVCPELVSAAERHYVATPWRADDASPATQAFDDAMAPFLDDPFRGAQLRRALAPGETSLAHEARAARAALAAAKLTVRDVDLLLVTSFLPDQVGVGNAAFLARELGFVGAAWNLEAACASALVAFETACGLVRAGQHRAALVVTSCSYSRVIDPRSVLAWTAGDGASALVVARVPAGEGLLGCSTVHTAATCGTFAFELTAAPDAHGVAAPRIAMTADRSAGRVLRETSAAYVRECCDGAARAAGVRLADVDFFLFNTPTAWFAPFAARVLGVDPARTVDTFALYANVGPVLLPANLHHAASTQRLRAGDLVLLYAIGSVSAASAAVVRWGDVGVGPRPEPPAD